MRDRGKKSQVDFAPQHLWQNGNVGISQSFVSLVTALGVFVTGEHWELPIPMEKGGNWLLGSSSGHLSILFWAERVSGCWEVDLFILGVTVPVPWQFLGLKSAFLELGAIPGGSLCPPHTGKGLC